MYIYIKQMACFTELWIKRERKGSTQRFEREIGCLNNLT